MSWEDDVINYHKNPESFNDWCSYCGCEGGCNLCDSKSLEIALKIRNEKK